MCILICKSLWRLGGFQLARRRGDKIFVMNICYPKSAPNYLHCYHHKVGFGAALGGSQAPRILLQIAVVWRAHQDPQLAWLLELIHCGRPLWITWPTCACHCPSYFWQLPMGVRQLRWSVGCPRKTPNHSHLLFRAGSITEDIVVLQQFVRIYKTMLHQSKWWKSYKP